MITEMFLLPRPSLWLTVAEFSSHPPTIWSFPKLGPLFVAALGCGVSMLEECTLYRRQDGYYEI